MKKFTNIIVIGILAVSIVVLYILHFAQESRQQKDQGIIRPNTENPKDVNKITVAYINVDTLLLKYNFAKEASQRLVDKSERSQAQLAREMKQWQTEAMDFQRKVQAKAFLTQERAEQENARLMKRRQELEQLDAKLSQSLIDEQKKMNEQLKDTINNFLKEYNRAKKYEIILSNAMNDNVLYSAEGHNITTEVIEMLNVRYTKK